jgi:hypothetical protein
MMCKLGKGSCMLPSMCIDWVMKIKGICTVWFTSSRKFLFESLHLEEIIGDREKFRRKAAIICRKSYA